MLGELSATSIVGTLTTDSALGSCSVNLESFSPEKPIIRQSGAAETRILLSPTEQSGLRPDFQSERTTTTTTKKNLPLPAVKIGTSFQEQQLLSL